MPHPERGDRIQTTHRVYIVTRLLPNGKVGATAIRGGRHRMFPTARLRLNTKTGVFDYA